jgi:hypothetical protein
MNYDPERMSPRTLNVEQLQKGLSQHQMDKIQYECTLLKVTPQQLVHMAPHLFNEGVTSANTSVTESFEKPPTRKEEEPVESYPNYSYDNYIEDDSNYHSYA